MLHLSGGDAEQCGQILQFRDGGHALGREHAGGLHLEGLDEACVFALEHLTPASATSHRDDTGETLALLDVGTGVDPTIHDLAEAAAAATWYSGTSSWDTCKPDGTPKKQLDVSRLANLGWKARIPLREGLRSTVDLFRKEPEARIL